MSRDRVVCNWCPDTDAVWSRLLDTWRCPDCGGEDVGTIEEEE